MAENDVKEGTDDKAAPQTPPETPSAPSAGGVSSAPQPEVSVPKIIAMPRTTPIASPAAPQAPTNPVPPAPPNPQGVASPAAASAAHAPEAAPAASAEEALQTLEGEIKDILSNVKLPERREAETKTAEPRKRYDTSLVSAAESNTSAPAAPTLPPQDPNALASVRTLKHDLQDVVRDQKISQVRAAALEATKERPEPIDAEAAKPRAAFPMRVVMAILALLVLGAGALFGVYFLSKATTQQVPASSTDTLIFSEASRTVPLPSGQQYAIKQDLLAARENDAGQLGAITHLVPSIGGIDVRTSATGDRPATLREFLTAIGATAPDELLRALSDQFFLGIHKVDENAPFLLVPVLSYDRAFAGMLAWESSMNADLSPLFTPLSPYITNPDGTVIARTFTDDVIRNYDVRVLKDDSGTIQLYYAFPSRTVLVIAESPYSLFEIVTRLQAARHL